MLPDHFTKYSFVSEKHKLIYVSTPKAGCTTIKWWFANLVGATHSIKSDIRSEESDIDLKVHDIFPIVAPDVANLPNSSLAGFFERSDYLSFALVRNPYSRIFSAWQSKLLLREPLQYEPYKNFDFLDAPLYRREDIAKAFELFLEHLNEKEAPSFWDVHWSSQFLHLRPDLLPNLYISQLENVEKLRDRLHDHLGSHYIDPLSSRRRNDSLIPYSKSFLTEKAASLIRLLYKSDFEQFGYEEGPPSASAEISDEQLEVAIKAINMLRSRHQRIVEIRGNFNHAVAERDIKITQLSKLVTELGVQITELRQALGERKAQINQVLAEHKMQIMDLNQALAERNAQIKGLHQATAECDLTISNLREIELERNNLLEMLKDMRNSRSWRITRPIRSLKISIFRTGKVLKEIQSDTKKTIGRNCLRLISHLAERGVRLVPNSQDRIYSILRRAYHMLPVKAERKRIWADKVMGGSHILRNLSTNASIKPTHPRLEGQDLFRGGTPSSHTVARKRAMVIEHRIPTPDKTSGSVRLIAMCKLIKEEGWDIVFISDAARSSYHWVLEDIERDILKYENIMSDMGISYFYGFDSAKFFLETEGTSFDLVVLCYPEVMHKYAPLVRAYAPFAHLVYDTVDLHGLRFSREAEIKNDPDLLEKASYYEKIERAGISVADSVLAITPDEAQQIIARCGYVQPIIVPNIHSLSNSVNSYEERKGLLFIGHYLHSPNEDAVCHFVQDIYPLIEEQTDDIEFTMLGSSITDSVRQLARKSIHPVGYVEDPVPYFAIARVFVAPLRYGAGMKGKIGQALSLGLPVVTTSIGAEGMGLENERQVLIADTPHAFAAAVLRLYHDKDLWSYLSVAGREHILMNFSDSAAKPAISSVLKRATPMHENLTL